MNKQQTEAILRLANTGEDCVRVLTAHDERGWVAWCAGPDSEQDQYEIEARRSYRENRFPTESDALVTLLKGIAEQAKEDAESFRRVAENRRKEASQLDGAAVQMNARLGIIAGLLRQGGYE